MLATLALALGWSVWAVLLAALLIVSRVAVLHAFDVLGLTGKDGRLSFTKALILAVLGSAIARDQLSPWLALALVAAAFGRSTFLEVVHWIIGAVAALRAPGVVSSAPPAAAPAEAPRG